MRSSVCSSLRFAAFLPALFFLNSFAVQASSPIPSPRPGDAIESARQAYEISDYPKAVQLLQEAAAKDPKNPEIFLLLAKSYNELQQHDQAIASAEKAVALDPQNSVYHEWLGRAYGEKAEHAGPFSGMSLAKKTRKEFDTAVSLDEKNYSARQALIEFDCSAPGIVGGGEDKAIPQIAHLTELDAAEGHYAAGNCRRQKKDFTTADAEFAKSLDSHPKSVNLIYDIGDYAMKHVQPERLIGTGAVGFGLQPRLGLGMLTDEIPRPRERRRGGLVPRNDQRQYLVDQLLVAHGLVRLAIAAGHQHAQEVEMLLARAAPAVDELGDQLGQGAEPKCEFQVAVLLLGDDLEGIRA